MTTQSIAFDALSIDYVGSGSKLHLIQDGATLCGRKSRSHVPDWARAPRRATCARCIVKNRGLTTWPHMQAKMDAAVVEAEADAAEATAAEAAARQALDEATAAYNVASRLAQAARQRADRTRRSSNTYGSAPAAEPSKERSSDMPTLPTPPATTPALYAQDGKGLDAIVHAHYFVGGMDWYVTEYDPADGLCFGWAEIVPGGGELGYFTLAELADATVPASIILGDGAPLGFRVAIEFDRHWTPAPLRAVLAGRG